MRNNLQIKKEGYDLKLVGGHVPDTLEQNMQQGIDGLYQNLNSNSNVVFVIDEAKFGNSSLKKTKDGLQMSDSWLLGNVTNNQRLIDTINPEQLADIAGQELKDLSKEELIEKVIDLLENVQVERVLSQVSVDGIVTTYRLNEFGEIIGTWP